jgi:hypothetical protein
MLHDTKTIVEKFVNLTVDQKINWKLMDQYHDHQSFVKHTEPNYYVLFKESFFTNGDNGDIFLTKRQMVGHGNHYEFYAFSVRESDNSGITDLHTDSEFQDELFELSCVIKRHLDAGIEENSVLKSVLEDK